MTDISRKELLQHIKQHYQVKQFVPDDELDGCIADEMKSLNSHSRWSDGSLNWQQDLKEDFAEIDEMGMDELCAAVVFAVKWHTTLGHPVRNEEMYGRLFRRLIEVAERASDSMFEIAGKMSREKMLTLVKFHYANGKFYHVNDVDGTMESFEKIMGGQSAD